MFIPVLFTQADLTWIYIIRYLC